MTANDKIKKNDNVTLEILNYGCNAEGVAKYNGETVFVPYSLIGEKVNTTIIKANSKYSVAKINSIDKKSDLRIQAPCPFYTKCGGCQLQHTSYINALKIKTEIVQNAISNIGKLNYTVPITIASENEYHYRNKIAMPINPKTRRLGMFRTGTHNIVDIDNCLLQKDQIVNLIETINQYLTVTKNSIYDERTGKGLLKTVVAREINNEILVTIVINGNKLNDEELLINLLSKKFDKIGISLNINKLKNNVILTDDFIHIYGQQSIEINEFGIKYEINNQSFLQINDDVKNMIYKRIFDEAKNDIVINTYSGAGLLSAMLSKISKQVYGIEIVEAATKLADKLKAKNNIQNLHNICGDCSVELPKLLNTLTEAEKQNLTLVLDPPRKGCDISVLEAIIKTKPTKIIYVSCDPSTLARDLKILLSNEQYKVKYIQQFDMFPQTKHVETLTVIIKK